MPQATFVLKEPASTQPTLIYLLYRFNGVKLKYSTGQKVAPKSWNTEKQRVKELRTSKEHQSINFLLDELDSSVNNAYRKILLEGSTPTPELLRTRLNEVMKKENGSSKDLARFASTILESSPKKEGTKRAIKQTIRNLIEFKSKTGSSLHFDAIDLDFYDNYLKYAQAQGYSQNTIGSHIKNIKAFMREAAERGLTKNNYFRSKRFRKLEEESTSIYLSQNELDKLYKLDLENNSRINKVRDLFLIGCYTGLRFSDLKQLAVENISKDKRIIKVRTTKTEEFIAVPINPIVNSILDKYSGQFPQAISNEKMNEYLKELAEMAEINEPVEIISTRGGQRTKEVFKKYELVTVHTARRSFSTNAYLHNVPTISIMKITGHQTEKSFLKYIKISQEDNAQKLIEHPFFK